ncbi:MAG TPA: lasso peptide biosynthesis B2 protein [Candidatus Acidoferrum sp.]|nr:lasso peptide biosynthesis B2 protein [Candidatus Acidoferrum sp.]
MDKWRTFRRLSGFERAIVVEAAAALTVTWAGLRLAGFQRWKNLLARLASRPEETSAQESSALDAARVIARMEAAAARNVFFHPTCLERSMVLWWLLRSRGIPAELRVGARKEADRLEAHAWVELQGAPLNDAGESHLHFVPFDGPIVSLETPSH